jgi:hypothetical protein
MQTTRIIGVLLILYAAIVLFLTINKPKAVWKMKKIKMFEKIFGERGTILFFYIVAFIALGVGVYLLY